MWGRALLWNAWVQLLCLDAGWTRCIAHPSVQCQGAEDRKMGRGTSSWKVVQAQLPTARGRDEVHMHTFVYRCLCHLGCSRLLFVTGRVPLKRRLVCSTRRIWVSKKSLKKVRMNISRKLKKDWEDYKHPGRVYQAVGPEETHQQPFHFLPDWEHLSTRLNWGQAW